MGLGIGAGLQLSGGELQSPMHFHVGFPRCALYFTPQLGLAVQS